MRTFILRRLLATVPLVLIVTFICSTMLVLSPGNFLDELRLNPRVSGDYIKRMEEVYHLNSNNVFERYWYWLWPALHGDLGNSYTTQAPVSTLIGERVFNTLLLTGSALLFSWLLAIPFGVLAAVYRNRWLDKLSGFISYFGLSIPSVFFSLLAILFAAKTKLFPVGGIHDQANWDYMTAGERVLDTVWHLVLPTLVLGTIGMAQYMRQMRSEMVETLSQDFIRTARAKGLSRRRVIFRHALGNAINPLVTMFGFSLATLFSGALLTEYVFSWPGLGTLIYESLIKKDEPMVMAAVAMLTLMLVAGNLIADILLAIIDPRIRLE
jgi:peptide/nickel transport system permease protein